MTSLKPLEFLQTAQTGVHCIHRWHNSREDHSQALEDEVFSYITPSLFNDYNKLPQKHESGWHTQLNVCFDLSLQLTHNFLLSAGLQQGLHKGEGGKGQRVRRHERGPCAASCRLALIRAGRPDELCSWKQDRAWEHQSSSIDTKGRAFGTKAYLFLWLDISWVLCNGESLLSCNVRYDLFVFACLCLFINFPPLRHLIPKSHLSCVPYVYFRCEGDVMEGNSIIPPNCGRMVWLTWEAWGDQTIVFQRSKQGFL